MPTIVTIAGCPSPTSRATAVLHHVHKMLANANISAEMINMRHLPSQDLLLGLANSAPIQQSRRLIAKADGLIIATAICKGAYNGGLKAFFDLLPPTAFRGKTILPIALGASTFDFAAVDHSLRRVLTVLGANQILEGAYLLESQVKLHNRQIHLAYSAQQQIETGVDHLRREIGQKPSFSHFGRIPLSPAFAG
jgi:FMN reductase